jgi:hypothetical protein
MHISPVHIKSVGAAFRHPAPDTGSGSEGTKLRRISFWLSSAEGLQTKREEIS